MPMETRKIQVTGGGSSYIVTLPKKWVEETQHLKKNDPIGIVEQPDGTLLITTKKPGEQVRKVKDLDISKIDNPSVLFRLLIGIYIMGFSTIEIHSERRITPDLRETIQNFTQATIGPEVMSETETMVTIKDLIAPTEMPFDNTLSRMYILVKGMHEDAINALQKSDTDLAVKIRDRDFNVDRLHWLIARQSNVVMRDTMLSKEMSVTPEQAANFFVISRIMERIGDHAVRIADNIPIIIEKAIEKEIVNKIIAASGMALQILANSVSAWEMGDITKANETIESISSLVEVCEDIHNDAIRLQGEPPIAVIYIIESVRRTGEYAVDISEVTINLLMNRD
ncbi:MAG: phosphate uptake regulator PhoU [Promethearchaeota archaeon]|nr:MAG: phosphate uptake regulator PhoU [Candidatus Lokiarchaeota archaeon]